MQLLALIMDYSALTVLTSREHVAGGLKGRRGLAASDGRRAAGFAPTRGEHVGWPQTTTPVDDQQRCSPFELSAISVDRLPACTWSHRVHLSSSSSAAPEDSPARPSAGRACASRSCSRISGRVSQSVRSSSGESVSRLLARERECGVGFRGERFEQGNEAHRLARAKDRLCEGVAGIPRRGFGSP